MMEEAVGGRISTDLNVNPADLDNFGPWMLVTRKSIRNYSWKDFKKGINGASSSRTRDARNEGNNQIYKGKNEITTHVVMKDKVSQAVLEALGLINDKAVELKQISKEKEFEEDNYDISVNASKLKGRDRRPDIQISKEEVANGGKNNVLRIIQGVRMVVFELARL